MKRKLLASSATALAMLLSTSLPGHATPTPCDAGYCSVSVPGASLSFTLASPGVGTDGFGYRTKAPGGLTAWIVDGSSRLFALASYFRLDGYTREAALDGVDFDTTLSYDPDDARILVSYDNGSAPIRVDVTYTLQGANSARRALIVRDVLVTSKSPTPLHLSWFDYQDFDVGPYGITDRRIESFLHGGATRVIRQSSERHAVITQWPQVVQDGNAIYGQPGSFQLAVWGAHPSTPNLLSDLLDHALTSLTGTPALLQLNNVDFVSAVQFDFIGLRGSAGMRMSTALVLLGDVDGNGSVDLADLARINAALNQPAAGSDDPRDLDGDGRITVLDARKLVLLCTRPRCAPPQ